MKRRWLTLGFTLLLGWELLVLTFGFSLLLGGEALAIVPPAEPRFEPSAQRLIPSNQFLPTCIFISGAGVYRDNLSTTSGSATILW